MGRNWSWKGEGKSPSYFDAKAIHEMIVRFSPELILALGYGGKKAYDKILDVLGDVAKRKLAERDAGKRMVTIYDHNDQPLTTFEVKPPKRRR